MANLTQLRATPILAVGICWLAVLGCHKAPTPLNDAMTLEELNRALSLMPVPAGTPRTIETLTNFPGFKGRSLPVLPAGKKFIMDRATGKIVVGDQ